MPTCIPRPHVPLLSLRAIKQAMVLLLHPRRGIELFLPELMATILLQCALSFCQPQVWRLLNRYASTSTSSVTTVRRNLSAAVTLLLLMPSRPRRAKHPCSHRAGAERSCLRHPDSLAKDGAAPSTQRNCFLISASAPQVWRLLNRYGSL